MIYKYRDTNAIDTSLHTAEGSLITIENPDEVIGLKSLVADIDLIQSGTGTPSPTNVRPISGHFDVSIFISPSTSEADGISHTIDLGRAVYGGTFDAESGLLTVTWNRIKLSDLVWNYNSGGYFYASISTGLVKKAGNSNLLCDTYLTTEKTSVSTMEDFSIKGNANTTNIYIKDSGYTNANTWKTARADVDIVYELATPLVYQLSPQQIDLLLGENNIWTNSGAVQVSYAVDLTLYQPLPSEAVSINGRYLERLIDGYRTLYTKGRESLEVELGTYSTGTADGEKIKNRRYPSRVLTVGFQLQSNTPEEFRDRFNQLNNILSLEEADFIFADETDKFFTGTPIMDASVEAGQMNVTGEWKIFCGYPFKRSVEPITLTSTTDATISGNTATFSFNYEGVIPAKPLLRCEFAGAKSGGDYSEDGDCGFVAFLNADESIIQLGNPEVIDVDATNKNATLANTEFDDFTGWTNSGKTIESITDPYWDDGEGQTQNYASGAGTLTRNIASTIGFELDLVHRLCVTAPTQTGTFKVLMRNGSNTVVGFSIEKSGSGTAGTVKYIINNKTVGTDAIDLSQYNPHFGYCNRTPVYVAQKYKQKVVTYVKKRRRWRKVTKWVWKTRKVQKGWDYSQSNLNSGISRDGAVVVFSIGELSDRKFKDSDIATTACTSIRIEATGAMDTNAVRSVALIQKKGVPFAEIPNVFTAGDIVEADCNNANVSLYRKGSLVGHLEPQYGALGNDWEDFEIKVGQNAIRAVWSDWVNTNYKPVIKIIFNEVYI